MDFNCLFFTLYVFGVVRGCCHSILKMGSLGLIRAGGIGVSSSWTKPVLSRVFFSVARGL